MQQKASDPRIDSMFGTDRLWAFGAVIVLWALYVFVLYEVLPYVGDDNVLTALAVSGGLVLLFNTASIIAMSSHYAHDKEHIYGLDLHYLDIMKKAKA
jgi:Co/Zn/Cd efflux system component